MFTLFVVYYTRNIYVALSQIGANKVQKSWNPSTAFDANFNTNAIANAHLMVSFVRIDTQRNVW